MMKKYLLILVLISISLNQVLITPSYDQHATRRTKDVETTESWDDFLTKLLSAVFRTDTDLTVSTEIGYKFLEKLRNNGQATVISPELRSLISHAYFGAYNASPDEEILSAFCGITIKELRSYSFIDFYMTDTEHTISYTIKEPSLKTTVIDENHLASEELLLENQQNHPFEKESYSQLVDFYRDMIEFYPERTRYYYHLAWALSGLESPTGNRRSMIFTTGLSREFSPIPLYISRSKIAIILRNHRKLNNFRIAWSSYPSQPLLNREENAATIITEHALKYAIQFPELFKNQDGEWIEPCLENGEYTEDFLAAVKLYEDRAENIMRSNGVEIYGFWKDEMLQYLAMVPETGEVVGFRMHKLPNGFFEAAIDTFYKISTPTVEKIQDQAKIPFAEEHLVLLINKANAVMSPKDDLPDPIRIHRQDERKIEFSIFELTYTTYEPALEIINNRILSQDNAGVILIGGVTSAGKSPCSEVISSRIESDEGRRVVTLPMDMYFVDRDVNPTIEYTDSIGTKHIMKDFDNPQSLNIERLRDDLRKLLNGEEVDLPRYDFESGRSHSTSGEKLQLKEGDVLIIEGIHALNPEITEGIIPENMTSVTIFVDASEEIRLVRRILRDIETRGFSPIQTINQWPITRIAENSYIYPYIDNADVIINTDPAQEVWLESKDYEKFISSLQQAYLEAIVTGDARNITNTLQLLLEYGIEIPQPQIIQSNIPSQ